MRRRIPVLVSAVLALALAASAGIAPLVVRAADSPEAAVNQVLDTVISKQFDQLGPLICEEHREDVLATFDFLGTIAEDLPPGLDIQPLLDGMTFSVPDRSVTTLSEEGDTAQVSVTGTLQIALDEAAARAFITAVFEALGQPVNDALIDQMLPQLTGSLGEGTDLTSTVEVDRVDGQWLVCDDLEPDAPVESFDPNASPLPVTGALCDLISIEELNTLSSFVFVSATPEDEGCAYSTDATDVYATVLIRLEDGDLEAIKPIFTDGSDVVIAGLPGWASPAIATYVDIGDRLFVIQPIVAGTTDEPVDTVALAAAVGAIAIPRLPQ